MQTIQCSPFPDSAAKMVGYLHPPGDEYIRRDLRPCVLVLPGGGYRLHASHEAEPVAAQFYAAGYQVFLLYYSIWQGTPLGTLPLQEVSAAVALLKKRSRKWRIADKRIAVCGFSAGGHLAASLGTLYAHSVLAEYGGNDHSNRPDALILCYPVISAGEWAHSGSMESLAGGGDTALFSLEHQVTPQTPPVFLWHTVDDVSVPVENALLFLTALRRSGVPFECHLFDHGPHGMGLATPEGRREDIHVAGWFHLCLEWLGRFFYF